MQVHVSSSDHEGALSEWNVHVLRRNSGTWFKVKELVCYLVTGDCRSIAIFSHKSQFSVDRDHRPAKTKKQLIIVFRNLALENFFSQVESQKNGYVNIPFAFGLTHILFCWLGFLSSKSGWFDWQIQRAADMFYLLYLLRTLSLNVFRTHVPVVFASQSTYGAELANWGWAKK